MWSFFFFGLQLAKSKGSCTAGRIWLEACMSGGIWSGAGLGVVVGSGGSQTGQVRRQRVWRSGCERLDVPDRWEGGILTKGKVMAWREFEPY